jgi:hypothetical protein
VEWLASFVGLLAQAPPPAPPADGHPPLSPLEMGGIASIIIGGITAIGTQLKPVIDAWFADRRHAREIMALDLANDLAHANRKIAILEDENTKLKALVEHNKTRLDAIERHWKDEEPPVVTPCPAVVEAEKILPNLPITAIPGSPTP